jgi:hypothetical protein
MPGQAYTTNMRSPTVEDHLDGLPSEAAELFYEFVGAANTNEPGASASPGDRVRIVTLQVAWEYCALRSCGQAFATFHITGHGLSGQLKLPRPVDDPRFSEVTPGPDGVWMHEFALSSSRQLDETFAGWLREARDAGLPPSSS